MVKKVEVVGAVIVRNGLVLCARRGAGGLLPGLWEFPGGKIEKDESEESALEREIWEELSVRITVGQKIDRTTFKYDFASVTLTTYLCSLLAGEPKKSEHSELRWISPALLDTVDWAPADLPAMRKVQTIL